MSAEMKYSLPIKFTLGQLILPRLLLPSLFSPLLQIPEVVHFTVDSAHHLVDFLQTLDEGRGLLLVLADFVQQLVVLVKVVL